MRGLAGIRPQGMGIQEFIGVRYKFFAEKEPWAPLMFVGL